MSDVERFLAGHANLTRRFFLSLGAAGSAALTTLRRASADSTRPPELEQAISKLETLFTSPAKFQDVSRGTPLPHSLPDDKKSEVGLTRETWNLEVIGDPDNPVKLRKPMTKADGTALDFEGLMKLAETSAVRFPKVMTCLNIGCPLGMGIWEGVPLRDVFWLTQPSDNVRRISYHGYHNDDLKQLFRSSLPIGRVLEDPFDLPPVILCYKLNGQWLDSQRGGPVRVVVPEHYGYKSIKWLSQIILSSMPHGNDTYAEQGNDIDSPLKTFAATLSFPAEVKAGESIPVTGYAQVGISGLSKVQVWISSNATDHPAEDKYFQAAPWADAEILSPPAQWGGDLPDDRIPPETRGFDDHGRPLTWPMRLGKVHWAALLPGLPEGNYTLRCRTVDEQGIAQPLPRPFRKSGHAAIEAVQVQVVG